MGIVPAVNIKHEPSAWLSSPFRIIPRERSHTYGKRIVQYIPGNPMRWPDPISFNNSHLLARILEWF